ncbi:hypothetical protein DTO021C3_7339 [Paecilomyces variotii]|nr:hypothetical protein DTO195F2_2522 [Paecilomyces variotii]KAJ9285062.1 hypothetical protein DTO021C3_7339 [Paecilomyces variotii]KAJ9384867.1 hypothetical protein DTO063F5_4565 [Paecilomyces variotii]
MASAFQNAWQTALHSEKELLKALAEKEPTFAEITHFLSEFRASCQNAIFRDFEAARSANVEGHLWDAHVKINNRFRKLLARFREENGKKKPVEKRKLEKHYLDFIKSSQRFYRGYIQRLASHYGGVPELEKIAQKFSFDQLSAQSPVQPDNNLRKRVLHSCHATLIRLGDLSRYRETELVTKGRNWGPAIGYYDLAGVINPASGASHNQLAVIALADGNHLRAMYHLYRALSAPEPYPTSKGNLEIEFRKIMNAWAKRELIPPEDAGVPGKALTPWFVYLHAQCYKGKDFPEHDELENEVLSQLAVDLKERSLEGTLQKFCLVNIAAEYFATVRSKEEQTHFARLFFQRINVKTFFTLLQILLAELERFAEDPDKTGSDKVTVVGRRVLPALRHYSAWLLSNSDMLVAEKEESPLFVQIKEFWKIYANTLTLLASTFDLINLPEVDYLLEEDEETLGFKPLDNEFTSRRYLDANCQQKPRMADPGIERNHPNIEMLYRIREFVIDGLDLVVSGRIPVALVDEKDKKTFIYQEEGLPSQFFAAPPTHQHTLSSTSIEREDIQKAKQDPAYVAETRSVFGGSQSASASVLANMHCIVEGVERLVESDTYENPPVVDELPAFLGGSPPTPPGHTFEVDSVSPFPEDRDTVPRVTMPPPGLGPPNAHNATSLSLSQSYTPGPPLPSIWNSAFAPRPGEARSPQPRPATARQLSPPGLSQQPSQSPMATGDGFSIPSQETTASDIAFRNNLLLQRQAFFDSSPRSSPFQSSWTPPNPAVFQARTATAAWGQEIPAGGQYYDSNFHPRQVSSSLGSASWANNAFIASSLPSSNCPNSTLSGGRRSTTQLGAIGQTPPCGQGG